MNQVKKEVRCDKCGLLLIDSQGVSQIITPTCKYEPDCPSKDTLKKMGRL